MSDCVVVIRLLSGEDIIAILAGELEDVIRIEHPYFVKYSSALGSVTMAPYCAFTDEVFFELDRKRIDFLVTANDDIAPKFLTMVDDLEYKMINQFIHSEEATERFEEESNDKVYVEGNETKH